MKTAKGEMRPDYNRSRFATLERGKFHAEAVKGTAVALLEPAIAKAFPTSRSVNEPLAAVVDLTEGTASAARRSTRPPAKAVRAIKASGQK